MKSLKNNLSNQDDKLGAIAKRSPWLFAFITYLKAVEKFATVTTAKYPNPPMRIISHSMGSLIWLELFNRHLEWRSRFVLER